MHCFFNWCLFSDWIQILKRAVHDVAFLLVVVKKLSSFYTSDFQAMKWSWLLEKLKGSLRNTLNEWLSFKGHTLIWINKKKYLGYTSDS